MIERPVLAGIALATLLSFVVLVSGTAIGEANPVLRAINAVLAGTLIVTFLLRIHGRTDRLDLAMVLALALFALASVLSAFPRQSFDAVLAALTYVAGLWIAREQLADERVRRILWVTFMALSAILTIVLAGRWLVPTLEWWRAVGWQVIPPLNFELDAFPWGHRHDLTLLVVMIYPAWWIKRPSIPRRAMALALGLLGAGIVLVDGSRALWLAMAIASLVSVTPVLARLWQRVRVPWVWVAGAAVVVGVVLVASGLAGALIGRATSAATLEYRGPMWGAVVGDWFTHPVQGNGPGSFPWVLQLTGYFDTNSWAPRHPDSAVVQGLAEGGLVLLAAMTIVVFAVASELRRSRSRAATWALITFGIASINANPTDFAFLVVVAIAWLAYGTPREPSASIAHAPSWRVVRIATGSCLLVVALAYGSTLLAAFQYDRARNASFVSESLAAVDDAVALDPGLGLYTRVRGTAAYLTGDLAAAARDLRRATELNPADDLAFRTLALSLFDAGQTRMGQQALDRAIALQRSDPSNLLMSVRFDAEDADAILAETVQAWPRVVFALAWQDTMPSSTTTEASVGEALNRWEASAPMPDLEHEQGIWLTTLAGRADLLGSAVQRSGWDEEMAEALAASIRCEPVGDLLDAMSPSAQADVWYWWLRAREDIRQGGTGEDDMRMAALMGRDMPQIQGAVLNPLNENAYKFSADLWGYRRHPIVWPHAEPALPSHEAGAARWLYEPAASATEAGLDDILGNC